MVLGKRIYLQRHLADRQLIEQFAQIPVANICDSMERLTSLHPRIKLLSRPSQPIRAGSALTVKSRAGDNLLLHKALDIAQAGDFIVVDAEGDDFRAITGEIMISAMIRQQLAGLIIDGPVRDLDYISKLDFPVYATGSNPGGPYKDGPGEINVPIHCGQRVIMPGDIIVADRDGIIAIPVREAQELLTKAQAFMEQDQLKTKRAKQGMSDRTWVDKSLKEKGFLIIDGPYEL